MLQVVNEPQQDPSQTGGMLDTYYPDALKAVRDAEAALGVSTLIVAQTARPELNTMSRRRSPATIRVTPASAFNVLDIGDRSALRR